MTPAANRLTRAAMWGAAFLAGLIVGTIGAFLQAARSLVAGVVIPWGTVLVLVAVLLVVRGAVEWTQGRWAGWAALAGWLGATVLFATQMPWGALVISAGGRQMAYLIGGVILGSAAATIPPLDGLSRQGRLR